MSNPELPQDNPVAGLVPVTEQHIPLFDLTPKHHQALEQATVSYMQRSKIPFDAVGLALGKEIVADALHKGMVADGITGIEAKTSLQALIKTGMEQRTQVVQGATRIFREYQNEVQSGSDRFIGPYALSARHLSRVGREVARPATSKLDEAAKLNEIESKRRELLPNMAGAIISGLPRDQFPDVSIDIFPDASSQAKLVRNSIVSVWFRGNPLPLLQVADLQQFTDRITETFDPRVLAPLVEYIAEASGDDPYAIADYLRDMGMQVGDLFQRAKDRFKANEISGEDDPHSRDYIYNFFGRKLLLLHPALEEQELMVDKERRSESEYSLWGEKWSVVMDGVRVPNEEVLERAKRIAIAKGRNGTRFNEGIREWVRMKTAEEANEKRQKTLSKMLQEAVEAVGTADTDSLPASEFDLALDVNVAKAEVYRNERGIYREDKRIIKRADENLRRMQEADEELRRENGGELPEEMVLPWSLSAEDSRRRRSTVLLASQRRVEFEAQDTFMHDFFSRKVSVLDREEAYDFPTMDTPTLERMVGKLKREQEVVEAHNGGIIAADVEVKDVGRHIDITIRNLRSELAYMDRHRQRSNAVLSGNERKRLDDYTNLKQSLADLIEKAPTVMGIPKLFYQYSLSSRITALERIMAARTRREDVEGKDVGQKKMKKGEFEMNLNVARIEAAKIATPEEEAVLLHHLHEWEGATNISTQLRRFPFPPSVNSKEELVGWAQDMLAELPNLPLSFPRVSHDYAPSELQRMNRRNQIQALTRLIHIAQSPLFPSDELIKGVNTRVLLSALSSRYRYMKAQAEIDVHEKNYNEVHNEFLDIAFTTYKRHLEQQQNKYEGQLAEVMGRDPKKEFIASMKALDLAIDIPQQAQN